jgi:hypothetical protein
MGAVIASKAGKSGGKRGARGATPAGTLSALPHSDRPRSIFSGQQGARARDATPTRHRWRRIRIARVRSITARFSLRQRWGIRASGNERAWERPRKISKKNKTVPERRGDNSHADSDDGSFWAHRGPLEDFGRCAPVAAVTASRGSNDSRRQLRHDSSTAFFCDG